MSSPTAPRFVATASSATTCSSISWTCWAAICETTTIGRTSWAIPSRTSFRMGIAPKWITTSSGERGRVADPRDEPAERLVAIAEGFVHRVGEYAQVVVAAGASEVVVVGFQRIQGTGILHRNRAQHHLVEQREDGRVRADPQGQGQNSEHSEAGRTPQSSESKSQIVPHRMVRPRASTPLAKFAPCILNGAL